MPAWYSPEPEISESNYQTLEIYQIVQDQVIFTPNGKIYALNLASVIPVLQAFEIEEIGFELIKLKLLFGKFNGKN